MPCTCGQVALKNQILLAKYIPMKFTRSSCLLMAMLMYTVCANAQVIPAGSFRLQSSSEAADPSYGTLSLEAGKRTVRIQSIMAYGENVKGLTIRINKGFPFKLAPSQTGSTLNYVGTTLNLVLQPGDQALVSFIQSSSQLSGTRQLYLSGEATD